MRFHTRRVWFVGLVTGPVVLIGCTNGSGSGSGPSSGNGSGSGSGPSSGDGSDSAALATLTVHIGLFGGPARPSGGMALSNSPAENENVTAVDAAGRKAVARTNADGAATMRLAPGRYTVYSTYCGPGPHGVVLTANRTAHVQIDCPVP